jgi:hypothetical protein
MSTLSVNRRLTVKRRTRPAVENDTYHAFARRVVAAAGRRIAAGDIDGLADLLVLADHLDITITTAVSGLRDCGYSWTEIANRVGMSRQAAHQRWRYHIATDQLVGDGPR